MKFFFTSSDNNASKNTAEKYKKIYGQSTPENSDIIIAIGGDGFLLKTLHDYQNVKKS